MDKAFTMAELLEAQGMQHRLYDPVFTRQVAQGLREKGYWQSRRGNARVWTKKADISIGRSMDVKKLLAKVN